MAIALILTGGVASATGSTSQAVSGFGVTLPAGTLLTLGWAGASGAVTACSDNSAQAGAANVYTVRPQLVTGTSRINTIWCFTTRALLATDTITVTLSTTVNRRALRFYAWSGANGVPLDQTATAGTAASPLTVGPTATLTAAGELAINFVGWFGSSAAGPGAADSSGFTLASSATGTTTNAAVIGSYKLGVGTAAVSDTITFTNITGARGELLTFKQAAGALFLQSISGSAGFSGIRPKLGVQRKTLGTLTYSGAVVSHPTARLVTAGFAPSGSVTRIATLARTLTGALSFSGSRTAATAYARSVAAASLSFTGTRTSLKAVTKAISGALSFVGSSTRLPAKVLAAVLAPVGSLSRVATLARTLTAILAPVGVLKRRTNRLLSGAAQYAGIVITNAGANHFFAVFRPTGTTPTHGLPARTVYASLALTGNVARFTSRQLVSSLIASGVMTSQYLPPVPEPEPGGGGFGAVMDSAFFARYQVDGKWRGVKRVRA